jgi:hypothetical protein
VDDRVDRRDADEVVVRAVQALVVRLARRARWRACARPARVRGLGSRGARAVARPAARWRPPTVHFLGDFRLVWFFIRLPRIKTKRRGQPSMQHASKRVRWKGKFRNVCTCTCRILLGSAYSRQHKRKYHNFSCHDELSRSAITCGTTGNQRHHRMLWACFAHSVHSRQNQGRESMKTLSINIAMRISWHPERQRHKWSLNLPIWIIRCCCVLIPLIKVINLLTFCNMSTFSNYLHI